MVSTPSSSARANTSSSSSSSGGPWRRPLTEAATDDEEIDARHLSTSAALGASHQRADGTPPQTLTSHHPTLAAASRRTGRGGFTYTLPLPVPLHSLMETQLSPGPSTTRDVKERYLRTLSERRTQEGADQDDAPEQGRSWTGDQDDVTQRPITSGSRLPSSGTAAPTVAAAASTAQQEPTPLSGSLFDFDKFIPSSSDAAEDASRLIGDSLEDPKGKRPIRTAPAPARTLCLRHSMMANHEASEKLQQSLDALPVHERAAITALWSTFSSSSHSKRRIILEGILTMCCFSQLSDLSESLSQIIRIDPFTLLPKEVGLRVLGYLDAISLGKAAQVSKLWKSLADDDLLWRRMCGQHIERKCKHCGWALPLLERRRLHKELNRIAPSSRMVSLEHRQSVDADGRARDEHVVVTAPRSSEGIPLKRSADASERDVDEADAEASSKRRRLLVETHGPPSSQIDDIPHTKPWKQVYCERLVVERNWRKGRYKTQSLKQHSNGVMCLQMHHNLTGVDYPVLITGSYDRTAIVWRLDTFEPIATLRGHTRALRGLQFDSVKLITGAMDGTLRIWNWRSGTCLRTLQAGAPVVCLNYDQDVLASGLTDGTIKIWDFSTSDCFVLRGHTSCVNTLLLWDGKTSPISDRTAPIPGATSPSDPKYLFSGSDDLDIKIWDVHTRTCIRTLSGHLGQVQSLKLLVVDRTEAKAEEEAKVERVDDDGPGCSGIGGSTGYLLAADGACSASPRAGSAVSDAGVSDKRVFPLDSDKQAVLISGGLDNLVKLWDVETGKERTLFGSLEGVWSVAVDPLRLISGSHDRTVKIWNRDTGSCEKTLVGHRGAVTCLDLSDDMIVSGSDDGEVLVWSFAPEAKQ